ncbi:TPA: hypothetical protein ACVU5P_004175 [Vibrio parahaemolyticus]
MLRDKDALISARKELGAIGFNAAVRKVCFAEKCKAEDVYTQLSKAININDVIFFEAKKYGLPEYLVDEVLEFFNAKGLRFFRHQLWPTKTLIKQHMLSSVEGSAV